MDDERDAEDAIRGLDGAEFGRHGRRLRVEWTKQDRGGGPGGRVSGASRRSAANSRPTKTLFVINFDPSCTRTRDLERHFDRFGKVLNVRIRRNFAFIQYEFQEDATRALEATDQSKLMDRIISVEYAVRDDDDKKDDGFSSRRGRDLSPGRNRDLRRSPSPYGRAAERGSPDYGRAAERGSPNYGRTRSPLARPEQGVNPDHNSGGSPADDRYGRRSPVRSRS